MVSFRFILVECKIRITLLFDHINFLKTSIATLASERSIDKNNFVMKINFKRRISKSTWINLRLVSSTF